MHTTVVGLYIHGLRHTQDGDSAPTPMLAIPRVDAVEGMGLRQDTRYFRPADPGCERPRQVSLIDEGTIWRHEAIFGLIDRSFVKAQIVLGGDLFLPDFPGAVLSFDGGAELTLSFPRKPCEAMDLIHPGLREAMKGGQQGALARVTRTGIIALGAGVELMPAARQPAQRVAR